jgi:hypothetical protein
MNTLPVFLITFKKVVTLDWKCNLEENEKVRMEFWQQNQTSWPSL